MANIPAKISPEFTITFDVQRVIESKRAMRRSLAQLPIGEKLAMLEILRDRLRTIRTATKRQKATEVREPSKKYQSRSQEGKPT